MGQHYYHLACAAQKLPTRLTRALARHQGEVPEKAKLLEAIAQKKKNKAAG